MILIYSTQIADSRLVKLSTTGKVHIAVGQMDQIGSARLLGVAGP